MSNQVEAQYHSIWNGGETVVVSDVVVDFDTMSIEEWGDKRYEGYEPADDSELTNLDEEKVITPFGMEFTAMSSDEYEFGLNLTPETEAESGYDKYGNGIIVYNV